jgi:hypothetical protein
LQIWEERKLAHLQDLVNQNESIIVYMDARYDSSRFTYHGTAPIMDSRSGLVLEMVTRTKVECGNSWKIEDVVIEEGLSKLLSVGLKIKEAVHDDKNSVDTILAKLGIESQKDLWHKCKNLVSKFQSDLCDAKRKPPCAVEKSTCKLDLEMCTVPVLQKWLVSQKLSPVGKKAILVDRLVIS